MVSVRNIRGFTERELVDANDDFVHCSEHDVTVVVSVFVLDTTLKTVAKGTGVTEVIVSTVVSTFQLLCLRLNNSVEHSVCNIWQGFCFIYAL